MQKHAPSINDTKEGLLDSISDVEDIKQLQREHQEKQQKQVTSDQVEQENHEIKRTSTETPIEQKFKLYAFRWVIMVYFGLAQFFSTCVYATFSPISTEMTYVFDQSATIVSSAATLYLLMFPIFTFQASYLIMKKGIAVSINLGTFLTLSGTLIRCLAIYGNFYWVLVGQTIAGIGRPFILNAQANVTSNWFPLNQRTLIIAFFNFLVTVSGIVGNVVPGLIFKSYKKGTDSRELGLNLFKKLVISEGIAGLILLVPIFFIMKSNPPTPPSKYANLTEKLEFSQSVKRIFSDKKFLAIFLSFTFFNGTWKGFGVVMSYLVAPFGYTSGDIALLAVMPVVGGVVATIVFPKLQKKYGVFKPFILILQLLVILSFFLFYLTAYYKQKLVILFVCILFGLFLIPTIPFLLEWACKQVYPINDSFSVGILYSGATTFSSFIGEILTLIIVPHGHAKEITKLTSFYGIMVICSLYFLGFLMIFFVPEIKQRKHSLVETADKFSFHSAKVIRSPSEDDDLNEDLFKIFPATNPDGILFDILDQQRVRAESILSQKGGSYVKGSFQSSRN